MMGVSITFFWYYQTDPLWACLLQKRKDVYCFVFYCVRQYSFFNRLCPATNPLLSTLNVQVFYQVTLLYTVVKFRHFEDATCLGKMLFVPLYPLGTTVAQWLRCSATNRKVACSIPDGVIGIFHWHNPSDRTMALGSTQPLTEMSTRRISWG